MAKKNVSAKIKNDNELFKLIRTLLIILVLFLLLYGLTYFITNKKEDNTNKEEEVTSIQYSKIEIGTMLKQKRDVYYVLLAKTTDENKYSLYEAYSNAYYNEEENKKMYMVDLDSAFNESFISDKSNLDVDSISDFKVSQATLLKIENGKITETYEGDESVVSKLKELIK